MSAVASTALLRPLARQWRIHGPILLGAASEPHTELLTLVWDRVFDREHALGLLARQPGATARSLAAVLEAADQFDGLHHQGQRRLRRMIQRHQHLSARIGHAPHSVD